MGKYIGMIEQHIKKFIKVFLIKMGVFATIMSFYTIFNPVPSADYLEKLNYDVVVDIFKHTKIFLIGLMLIFIVTSIWYVLMDIHFENKRKQLGLDIYKGGTDEK